MIISVHQPNYIPYLGFFDKMSRSDIFVIYDDAQFNKEDFQHRNRIKIHQGWKWLTVPVGKKHIPINNIKIKNDYVKKGLKWQEEHLQAIRDNYKNAPFYEIYGASFENIYANEYDYLIDLNMDIINYFAKVFAISCKIILSSELGFTSKSTLRLVEIIEMLDGDTYISGSSGRDYLNESLFENKGINVEYQDFNHPTYKQCHEGFIPNMCSIDSLFNVGALQFNGSSIL